MSEPMKITDLPFVARSTDGTGHNFWAVEPTGDYLQDCQTGAQYALAALDFIAREGNFSSNVLSWAILAMKRHGPNHNGIEIGFLSVITKITKASYTALPTLRDVMKRESTGGTANEQAQSGRRV